LKTVSSIHCGWRAARGLLLRDYRYDEDTGIFYIITPSPVLPLAMLQQDGDVTPVEPLSEL